jgi:hypothetical protein
MWLMLDSESELLSAVFGCADEDTMHAVISAASHGELATVDVRTQSDLFLAPAAGGGVVMATAGLRLLRAVPRERLHVAAAEANFKRAAQGCSMVALRHATILLGLLQEQESFISPDADAMDTRHTIYHHTRGPPPIGSQLLEAVARARRAQECVANQAAVQIDMQRFDRPRPHSSASVQQGKEISAL